MNTNTLRAIAVAILALATTACWALIIWVALHVSSIVLDTLQTIIDLAAISA